MAMPELDMMPPGEGATPPAGPYALIDELVAAVLAAKGADPQMVATLPPLSDEMITPELEMMLADLGMGGDPVAQEAAMWDEADAADLASIPCNECPDPAGCQAAGVCQLGLA